jgi:hypothetical protein
LFARRSPHHVEVSRHPGGIGAQTSGPAVGFDQSVAWGVGGCVMCTARALPYSGGDEARKLPNGMDGYSLMMRQRPGRLTALVASLLVMQLTVTGNDYACPIHASENAHRETGGHAHAMSAGGVALAHQATHLATGEDMGMPGHCDFPCAPAACGSAVTCNATVAVATGSCLCPVSFASTSAVALTALAPQSRSTAPEPPPPRA